MPADHRLRLDNDGARLPIRPSRRQPDPQQSISSRHLRPLHRPLKNTKLVTKGQNLKLKRRTMAKERHECRREHHQRRRTRESKEERHPPIYQQLRGLREPQSARSPPVKGKPSGCAPRCLDWLWSAGNLVQAKTKILPEHDMNRDSGAEGSLDPTNKRILVSFYVVSATAQIRTLSPRQLPTNHDPAAPTQRYQSNLSSLKPRCCLRLRCLKLPTHRQMPRALVGGRHLKQPRNKLLAPVEGIEKSFHIRNSVPLPPASVEIPWYPEADQRKHRYGSCAVRKDSCG